MCPAKPISLLTEMALPAQLVAVVIIDFVAFLILKEISFLGMMAIYAAEILLSLPMFEDNIAVGQFPGLIDRNRLVGMTAAAFVAGNCLLSGQYPE